LLQVNSNKLSRSKSDQTIQSTHAYHQHVLRDPGLMFFEDTDRHHLAHIHVRYAGDKAAIAIDDGRVLAGSFPPKQLKMVQAWIEIHKDELVADWELAKAGEQPYPIDPLR
jgi:hypothetical protein